MHNSELSIVYVGLDAINRRHCSKFGSRYLLYLLMWDGLMKGKVMQKVYLFYFR